MLRGGLDSAVSCWFPVVGFCEEGDKPSGFIKGSYLLTSQLFIKF